jgi:glycosyltransferase involved in cell wall biosynthesis
MRVLFPTHLDKATNATSIVLRELALRLPQHSFYSFSQPATPEDRELGDWLWELPHLHRIRPVDALRMRFDVVHHHAATRPALAMVGLSKARSLGRCWHVFTSAQVTPQASYYPYYRLAVQRADCLVALSRHVATSIETVIGCHAHAIIPNGVDLAFFDPQVAHPVDLPASGISQPYVLFVGVLNERKRPDVFINLARLLPQFTFVVVGDAFLEEHRRHYRQMGAAYPNVVFLGQQPRAMVRDLMAQAVALVFPSEREGLPLTVLEAAAMGLPVLAQPRSSLPEVIAEGITGWLLSMDQPEAWAQKIQELVAWSAPQRQVFGERARAFVTTHFSWEHAAQRYAEVYQSSSATHT